MTRSVSATVSFRKNWYMRTRPSRPFCITSTYCYTLYDLMHIIIKTATILIPINLSFGRFVLRFRTTGIFHWFYGLHFEVSYSMKMIACCDKVSYQFLFRLLNFPLQRNCWIYIPITCEIFPVPPWIFSENEKKPWIRLALSFHFAHLFLCL